jgi:glycosyltransferase involved in cell wall biosynthesis
VERYYRANENQRREFRVEHGFPENAVVVGSVANLRPVKAIDVFLEAAKLVVQEKPEVYFVVVGDGPERANLEKLVQGVGIANNVRFFGSRTDIPELLSCMDIGVLSSSSESFSNAIVEYMAAGLAVVCTDVGGAREAVEDGVTGYFVHPREPAVMANKLLNIIKQQECRILGENGRKKCVGSFSHQEMFRKYQECYEELASRRLV